MIFFLLKRFQDSSTWTGFVKTRICRSGFYFLDLKFQSKCFRLPLFSERDRSYLFQKDWFIGFCNACYA